MRMQVNALADAGSDCIALVTCTYSEEAVGVARAAAKRKVPVTISFTLETDGNLPGGESLRQAVLRVDSDTDRAPLYYGVNCVHPNHVLPVVEGDDGAWKERLGEVNSNPSELSHSELDTCTSQQVRLT